MKNAMPAGRQEKLKRKNNKAITLVELVIAISLVGMVALTAGTIEIWARRLGTIQDKQTELLNRISPVMEHMVKSFQSGVGYKDSPAVELIDKGSMLFLIIRQNTASPGIFNRNTDIFHYYELDRDNHLLKYKLAQGRGRLTPLPNTEVVLAENVQLEIEPRNIDYDNDGNDDNDTQLIYQVILSTRQSTNWADEVNPITNPEVALRTAVACRLESIS